MHITMIGSSYVGLESGICFADFEHDMTEADVVLLGVVTPSRRGDGLAHISHVYAAAADIAQAVQGFTVIVTKSTVPVGTGDEVEAIVRETKPNAEVVVVSNPEFRREGAAIEDFKRTDGIVIIGREDGRAREVMAS